MDLDRDELVRVFRAEAEEHLTQMEEGLLVLEAQPADDEALGAVFRGIHTLKGNLSVLELPAPEEMAHAVEGLLDRLRARDLAFTSPLITLLLAAVDALRELVPDALAGKIGMRLEHSVLVDRVRTASEGQPVVALPVTTSARASIETPSAHTLRIDVGKLDRMLDLVGEIAVARGRLFQQLERLGAAAGGALDAARETDALCHDLQELVMGARMVPIGSLFRRHARAVRDLAAENGRRARLVVEGEEVEVDMTVIERLADPLTHMIRNAVDHGIETPEVRGAAGKDPCGTVTLRAFHDSGSVVVQVQDDGAGLDRARIAARARERGGLSEAHPSDAEIDRLIFEPGFSTADRVTTLSGRGVGMDVVRRNIEVLRGTITVESRPQGGTTLTIRLPLTLAIIDGLAVGVAGETYILPIDRVVECVELPAEAARAEGEGVVPLRGQMLPYLRLRHLFDLAPATVDEAGKRGREYVVVVRHGDGVAGLAVDALRGETQAVIKPLDKVFRRLPGLAGSTILGDGRVALILDVALLFGGARVGPKAA
jgi:two-component system chemotaxis sensor kinase CheA